MVDADVQASLADTPLADPSGAGGIVDVVTGTDAQVSSTTSGIDAQTDRLELAFEASIVNLKIFDNDIWIEEQSMDTNEQKGTRQLKERRKKGIVPSPEGENQVGKRKEQSASRRMLQMQLYLRVFDLLERELERVDGLKCRLFLIVVCWCSRETNLIR
ncbi:hypothetical protein H5410_005064, partial [Solanum commersonii]